MIKQLSSLLKLRIGVIMALTAMVAMVVTPGRSVEMWEALVLGLTVLLAAGSAGAFNQYYERDIDQRMARTRNRPFVTGRFRHSRWWLLFISGLLVLGVGGAALALNGLTALYILLGAFFYAIIYTVWLKRRTWLNIVIGGASGSFAVLAGASLVDPALGPIPVILAIVLFRLTPSHFWSLAIARHDEYAAANVPMLPVVAGDQAAAKAIMFNTLLLVIISITPILFGLGWIYLLGALSGGGYFLYRNIQLVQDQSTKIAMTNFFASLIQLAILLSCAVLDNLLLG